MNNILAIKNLTKEYKDFTLKDISFNLERGYIMGFIGPNGAGKSTTIKLIMNLIKKDSGQIEIFGLDNIKNEIEIKEKIGFVYDENHFYEELTLREMTSIIAPFYKKWDEQNYNKYIKLFNLPSGNKIKTLSKGMKMKYSLAVALSHDAELIIMDEPTSGLDPIVRDEVLDILRDLMLDENQGILFSTHITTDLDKVADYITFVNQGELVLTGCKDEIIERYAIVKGSKELLDRDVKKQFIGYRENNYGFEALTDNISKTRSLFKDSIIIEKPTLEDIMLYTVRRPVNA